MLHRLMSEKPCFVQGFFGWSYALIVLENERYYVMIDLLPYIVRIFLHSVVKCNVLILGYTTVFLFVGQSERFANFLVWYILSLITNQLILLGE